MAVDVDQLESLEDIQAALQALEFDEITIADELDDLLLQIQDFEPHWQTTVAQLTEKLDQLQAAHLEPVQQDLGQSARLAAQVQQRVERLDAEQAQVHTAREEVDQVIGLQQAIGDLEAALRADRVDQAAALVHRYLVTHAHLLRSELASFIWPPANLDSITHNGRGWWDLAPVVVSTKSSDESDAKTLAASVPPMAPPTTALALFDRVQDQLVQRVSAKFDDAVNDHDTRGISQCFKLFPLLQQEMAGLDRYSQFLCQTLGQQVRNYDRALGDKQTQASSSAPSKLSAVTRLTALFEIVARLIDNHFAVVETHYGPGKMVRVIQYLQRDIDARVCRIVENFREDEAVDRRLAEVRSYDDSHMGITELASASTAPSLSPQSTNLAAFGPLGKRLLASRKDTGMPSALWKSSAGLDAKQSVDTGSTDPQHLQHDVPDIKEINRLLAEMASIIQRISLYQRFLESRAEPEVTILQESGIDNAVLLNDAPGLTFSNTGILTSTLLPTTLGDLVATYLTMETFAVHMASQLALQWDEQQPGELISSGVDDVFFIAKRSLLRALSTAHGTIIRNLAHVLQNLFNLAVFPFLQRKVLQRPRATTAIGANVAGWERDPMTSPFHHTTVALTKNNVYAITPTTDGTLPEAFANMVARNQSIIVALNNFDTSVRYVEKLIADASHHLNPDKNSIWATHPKAELKEITDHVLELQGGLLEQFALLSARPSMRLILQESYRDIKYVLSDEEYMDVKNDNLFVQRFVIKFNAYMDALKAVMTDDNFGHYLNHALDYLITDWEKAVSLSKFNLLGGFCFDSDLRTLQQHFSLFTQESLRNKFAKLGQMAEILTVETVEEATEIWQLNSKTAGAYLSAAEFKRILANR
ncbi:Golgi transport complex subunit 4 [Dimargaris xerosporica]|nr:Golgi transport complex subunit 4 [Dimargaris xerosporica]